jgi:hypothetical protein
MLGFILQPNLPEKICTLQSGIDDSSHCDRIRRETIRCRVDNAHHGKLDREVQTIKIVLLQTRLFGKVGFVS